MDFQDKYSQKIVPQPQKLPLLQILHPLITLCEALWFLSLKLLLSSGEKLSAWQIHHLPNTFRVGLTSIVLHSYLMRST